MHELVHVCTHAHHDMYHWSLDLCFWHFRFHISPKHSECHVKRNVISMTLPLIWVVDGHKLFGNIVNPTEIKVDWFLRQANFSLFFYFGSNELKNYVDHRGAITQKGVNFIILLLFQHIASLCWHAVKDPQQTLTYYSKLWLFL